MATPVRSALTTSSIKTSGTSITTASVTVNAGEMLVVMLAYDDVTLNSVVWNGINLDITSIPNAVGAGVRTRMGFLYVTSTASSTITATWASSITAKAWAVSKSTNVNTLLGTSSNTGTGTAPDSGTISMDEHTVGIFFVDSGTEGPSGDTVGTATNSFTLGQRSGSTGNPATGNITTQELFRIVSSNTNVSGGKTGQTSRDWAAVGGAFGLRGFPNAQAQAQILHPPMQQFGQSSVFIKPGGLGATAATGTSVTTAQSSSLNVKTNDLIVVYWVSTTSVTSITDTDNNTWVIGVPAALSGINEVNYAYAIAKQANIALKYTLNFALGNITSIGFPSSTNTSKIWTLYDSNSTAGTGTAITTPSINILSTNNLALALFADNTSNVSLVNANQITTLLSSGFRLNPFYNVVDSPSVVISGTIGASQDWVAIGLSFFPATRISGLGQTQAFILSAKKSFAQAQGRISSVYEKAVKKIGPASYWKLDESSGNVKDQIGGITGVVGTNGPPTYGTSGIDQTAITFVSSSGHYFDFGDVYAFTGTAAFSIILWFKHSAADTDTSYIMAKNASGWEIEVDNSGIYFLRRGANSVSTVAVIDGQWQFLAAIYTGTQRFIHVDNVKYTLPDEDTDSISADATQKLVLGTTATAIGDFYGGDIDEVAIFTSAISYDDIQAIYTIGKSGAVVRPGQAQAKIKSIGVQAFGQAKTDIKVASRGYAQSQADIKHTYQGYAQSKANIKVTSNVFAQSQADILVTSQVYAQAQAKIATAAVVTNTVFAQANAFIAHLVAYDTFTRTVASPNWGSGYNIDWLQHTQLTGENISVNGTEGIFAANSLDQVYISGYPYINIGMYQFDIYVFAVPHDTASYNLDSRTDNLQVRINTVPELEFSNYDGDQVNIPVNPSTWYTVKATVNSINGSVVWLKAWERGTLEPDWQVQGFSDNASSSYGTAGADLLIVQTLNASEDVRFDNLYIWNFENVTTYIKAGFAQADILATSQVYAQAQAQITRSSQGFGQTQADIKHTYQGYAQANSDIKATSNAYAQSQADIKATTNKFAQAQGNIKATSNAYAQSNADIKKTTNQFAQSQADIKVTTNVFAQANADIKQTTNTFAQANADIKKVTNAFAQANADIKATSNAYGQAQANINVTTNQFAQANSDIKVTSNAFAQSQARITNTYQGYGQTQACIKGNAFAQAQADIKQTYQVYAQGQADIKVTSNGFAQANADILSTILSAHAQAQADILTPGKGFAQSNAGIKVTTNQFAQAQADILHTYQGYAQAQACIKGNAFGQAQADIKQTSQVYAQTQADIDAVSRGYGQANADIKVTTNVFAQANADIKVTTQAYAQTQADIRVTTNQYAQTQADIKATSNAYAQSNADIKVVSNAFGQAQADIDAVSNAYAQSQADIKSTSQAYAQAQADIKVTTNVYSQAQADIKSTSQVYAQSNADILVTSRVYAQAQACIKGNGFGQAQADILATSQAYAQAQAKINAFNVRGFGQANASITSGIRGFAQAQADIKAKSNGYAQVQATIIKKTGFGQAQADIKATSRGYAQAQACVKGNAFGQAQADILKTQQVYGQTQADIKTIGQGYGQAQVDIKATGQGYGQAQSDIKSTTNKFAQTQADIKSTTNVFGQAQGTIIKTAQVFAQANADIKSTSNGYAQSQADIKSTSNGYAQAQSDIKQTYQGYAQAQVYILILRQGYGQSQAAIRTTVNQYAQAQADIRVTSNRFAQAQATISTGNEVFAQAQANIKVISTGYGQAQATITSGTEGHGQAQAYIYRTENVYAQAQAFIVKPAGYGQAQAEIVRTHTLADVQVSDDIVITVSLSDDAPKLHLDDIENNDVELVEDRIIINLDDEQTVTINLSDSAYV